MKKHTNTRYDGEILSLLLEAEDIGKPQHIQATLQATQLQAGMVLSQNLYNDSHILILPEGHVFSEATIHKLRMFEKEKGKPFSILIEPEKQESAVTES